jgi:beta-xylosidase
MKKYSTLSTFIWKLSTFLLLRIISSILFTFVFLSEQDVHAAIVAVHDPSVTIAYKDASGNSYPTNDAGGTRTKYYYVFGTQVGAAYSTDMINWTAFTPTFSINGVTTTDYYQLVKSEADYAEHTTSNDVRGNLWAPDIIYNKALGKWTLYFSLSGNAFKSSIIMFTSSKIEGNYERVGTVIYGGFTNAVTSNARTDYAKVTGSSTIDGRYLDNNGAWDNTYSVSCIDPAVSYDQSGKLWMSYGSWSGGIFLLKLNEQTGLRDYTYNYGFGSPSVWNVTRLRFDQYMGIHIGGGYYVSGEGSYIRYIKDPTGVGYYYLFISMGFYSPDGGYTMRVFRSSTIDGVYTDVTGDNAVFPNYVFNYGNNTQYGMPIMQNYKYNWWSIGDVAQGHNSVLTEDDGSAYMVYHTKHDDGTVFHNVEVHQLLFSKKGWPLAAPFEYRVKFGLSKTAHSTEDIAGRYSVITHNPVDYANLKTNQETEMYINADGTLTGSYTGTWVYNFSAGKQYLTLTTNAGVFEAVVCEQLMDFISTKTIAFTGMNATNERCLWGYKRTSTATINTTNYLNQSLLIGNKQYTLTAGDYANFNKQTVSGDYETEYTFDNYSLEAQTWNNWELAIKASSGTWYLRADASSTSTFAGSTVNYSYTWNSAQLKTVYQNKKVKLKVSRTGTTINIFAYANDILVYTSSSINSPTGQVDVYLGGESCYLDVHKISVSNIGTRQVVGTANEDGTYTVPFNTSLGNTTTVTGDFNLRYNFNNYHNPTSVNSWDNYILRVLSGSNTMLIRADAYALTPFGTLTFSDDWNGNAFLSMISGANIDCNISRLGSTVTYKSIITARDGTVYNYQVIQTNAPTTDLTFGYTGEKSMQDFFVVEKSVTINTGPTTPKPMKYVYNYDNSGNYAWSNTNSWTPKAVPTAIDTVIVRTGEVQIGNLNQTAPFYVETNGTLRLIDTSTVVDLHLQGGTLKVATSAQDMMLTSNIAVEQASTINVGSIATTVFTLNGNITGNSNLTKTSVGNLRINSTASGFKGNWIISDGKLQLQSATGLGICGVQVQGTARLDIEVAGASIYSLVVASTAGVDLGQNLNVNVAVFGSENILSGAFKNANYPTYIGSTGTLNVSNSLVNLSGSTSLCTGSSITLTASSGTSYIWNNNTTQVGTDATYAASNVGNYTVNATNAIGCKVTSAPVTITVATAPTATITSPATAFCTGGSIVLTASTGSSYKWLNGTTQVGTAATYTATAAGSYTVELTNAAGCKATSVAKVITVNPLPVITQYVKNDAGAWTATIMATACEKSTINLGPQPTLAAGWSWTGPNNFTSTLRNPVLANITLSNAGTYSSTYTDPNGCKASSTFALQVSTPPTATITAPATSFCAGGSAILSANTGTGLTYQWSNASATIFGATAATYTATAAGAYTVEVTNASVCSATSTAITVTVNAAPTATITANGPTNIPQGGSVVLTASAGSSYKWFNGTAQVGTGASYTSTTVGAYTVEVTNASGCKATSAATTVNFNTNQPSTITITSPTANATIDGIITITATATDPDGSIVLVEYLDGNTVIGTSTTQPYNFDWTNPGSGNHVITVRVTDSNGGITTSAPVTITSQAISTGVFSTSNSNSLNGTVYPNPANGIVFIDSDSDLSDAKFMLVDVLGNERGVNHTGNGTGATIDLSNLSAGTYVLISRPLKSHFFQSSE